MTLALNFRTVTDQSVKLSEPRRHNIDLRVAQQTKMSWQARWSSARQAHSCGHSQERQGRLRRPAAPSNGSGEYAVRYWATYIDGKKVREVDQLNFICYVNGTDYLADVRKAHRHVRDLTKARGGTSAPGIFLRLKGVITMADINKTVVPADAFSTVDHDEYAAAEAQAKESVGNYTLKLKSPSPTRGRPLTS